LFPMRFERPILAWSALLALLSATLYAPLFHVHDEGAGAPLVHAHLPELEAAEDEGVVHMEPPHSHAAARSIDLLITIACQLIHLDATVESSAFLLIDSQPSAGFVPPAARRAHAPPALEFLTPRAPPA
jgi:hypothetical protein